jgi:hypothetical protein
VAPDEGYRASDIISVISLHSQKVILRKERAASVLKHYKGDPDCCVPGFHYGTNQESPLPGRIKLWTVTRIQIDLGCQYDHIRHEGISLRIASYSCSDVRDSLQDFPRAPSLVR